MVSKMIILFNHLEAVPKLLIRSKVVPKSKVLFWHVFILGSLEVME